MNLPNQLSLIEIFHRNPFECLNCSNRQVEKHLISSHFSLHFFHLGITEKGAMDVAISYLQSDHIWSSINVLHRIYCVVLRWLQPKSLYGDQRIALVMDYFDHAPSSYRSVWIYLSILFLLFWPIVLLQKRMLFQFMTLKTFNFFSYFFRIFVLFSFGSQYSHGTSHPSCIHFI